jgi:hypothetical protein
MGAQKAIAEQIVAGCADYVLALKGNQRALHQAVIDHIDEQLEGNLADAREHVTTEKGHGREETAAARPSRPDRTRPGYPARPVAAGCPRVGGARGYPRLSAGIEAIYRRRSSSSFSEIRRLKPTRTEVSG